ncbi:MAG TPA: DUF2185 domain-containing protein [Bacteroidales bacterium]|nr:DUF2185 domain-containing protein [Bacteroidales bacterium]
MSSNNYKLKPEDIKDLINPMGYCYASDQITIDGMPVGFMYREKAEEEEDSGWRFYSGKETQEYVENGHHFMMFDLNYIANCDPAIIPYLKSKREIEYERIEGTDKFEEIDGPF